MTILHGRELEAPEGADRLVCQACEGSGGTDTMCARCYGSGIGYGAIVNDDETAVVYTPHGRFDVRRRRPWDDFELTATHTTSGDSGGLIVTASGRVKGTLRGIVSGRQAPPPLALVDALVLAAQAWASEGVA